MVPVETLDQVASALKRRGLAMPAVLLLEMHRPLMGCMREMYTMVEPVALAVFGSTWMPVVRELLNSPEDVDRLIESLERPAVRGGA
jgi:hypothetical protein